MLSYGTWVFNKTGKKCWAHTTISMPGVLEEAQMEQGYMTVCRQTKQGKKGIGVGGARLRIRRAQDGDEGRGVGKRAIKFSPLVCYCTGDHRACPNSMAKIYLRYFFCIWVVLFQINGTLHGVQPCVVAKHALYSMVCLQIHILKCPYTNFKKYSFGQPEFAIKISTKKQERHIPTNALF